MRPPIIAVLVPVVALLTTAFLPFVNRPALWLGLPSVMVWTVLWVLALSAALAWVEFGRRHPDDAEDWSAAVPPPAGDGLVDPASGPAARSPR